ncbi:GTP pyrophosphokinase family protein [Oceanobacillus sp. J11TS1]|uniref:GTP pyrophosphokinase n=1 Tax=Oceanobacillus sp. J11TS1 TaxID=2807191 RepID=UPI001B20E1D6|nr:GTP pyrophosphokinase family protein [Oceanobacillus sp. J11TS1]GIO24005.1 GTP pyrophosphokinase [Oceanobacillus sp. J11TS1]
MDDSKQINQLKAVRKELTRFMLRYKFGLDEMNTKLHILQEEFEHIHDYNPIEHLKSRIKSPESILRKCQRKNVPITQDSIGKHIKDIAGIRIVCSFISDIYKISEIIQGQQDIKVIEIKDYIKNPKPNGYKSLHLILSIPVFFSDCEEEVFIEIQIRTVAMDFWASLEHKIYYKYDGKVPAHLVEELTTSANIANQLDEKMEFLHQEMKEAKEDKNADNQLDFLPLDNKRFPLPKQLLESLMEKRDKK